MYDVSYDIFGLCSQPYRTQAPDVSRKNLEIPSFGLKIDCWHPVNFPFNSSIRAGDLKEYRSPVRRARTFLETGRMLYVY